MKPADRRACYDPLARDLICLPLRLVARSPLLARLVLRFAERIIPGVPGEIIGRTKYIDDCLRARIDDGIEQLVILGTGYDSRAYRFEALRGKVKVFEMDHPATVKMKMKRVKRALGSLPDHVVFVPIDFEKDDLGKTLFDSGYDKRLKTFFIWEGVTFYLTAKAVDETLAFVAGNSAEGSSIVFDYVFQSVLQGASEMEQINRALKAWERVAAHLTAEHFVFGVREGTIEEFLSNRGFSQVENLNRDAFKTAYFNGAEQSEAVSHLCGFVHAIV